MALLGTSAHAGPPVGLQVIDELVNRVRASGLRVSYRISGDGDSVPDPMAETTYRLVQEAITNALKHAPGAAIGVSVDTDRDAVRVEVTNDELIGEMLPALRDTGGGNGLTGMRERIESGGGTLRAGPTALPGWQVSAWLPLRTSPRVGHSSTDADP
jgi:signal transduction histidine kinase